MDNHISKIREALFGTAGTGNDHEYICRCRPVDLREVLKEVELLKEGEHALTMDRNEWHKKWREAMKEIERLREDRKSVESYLLAVKQCARLHPDGYTIVDFQQAWLDQERAINTELSKEIKRLQANNARIEADCLFRVSKEMRKWTRRCDDAKRIPDVLHEMAHKKQMEAKRAGGEA